MRSINRMPADRPPIGELCIDPELVKTFLGRSEAGFEELRDFTDILGLDVICVPPPEMSVVALNDIHADTVFPKRDDEIERWRTESRMFVCVTLNGGFFWGSHILGFRDFMLAIGREEADVSIIMRKTAEMNIRLARHAVEWGAHAVILGDDIAFKNGTYTPISFLDRYYFPFLKLIAEEMSASSVPVFFHSDGDLRKALPSIVETGVTGIHGLEEASYMDLAAIKKDYGSRLCLWGNMDPKYLVSSTDRAEIERQVRRIMSLGSPGAGFIFGTCSGLFDGMRRENLLLMYQIAREFRSAQ